MNAKPGRNAPCPCGSGRKYKKCCLKGAGSAKETVTSDDWEYCHHVVAFLDLMGQRQLFKDMPGVPEGPEGEARLIDILKGTVGYIKEFRKGFKDIFDGIQTLRPIPAVVPSEFHKEWRAMQRSEIKMQTISDAVVAWSPVNAANEQLLSRGMNGIWGILIASAGMNLLSLAVNHPVRGGIDVDGAIPLERGGSEIYGRALNCAYELESHAAQSPRIVIGQGVLDYLSSVEGDGPSSRFVAHAKLLAKRCRGLITTDEDNRPILHFLGAEAREVMLMPEVAGKRDYKTDVLIPAHAFVKASVEQFRGDEKLGPRYQRLLRYFDRHAPAWHS